MRLLLSSTRELAESYLHSREAHALLACWGMHLDFGPDVSGGAMFPFLEAFTDLRTGIALGQGGASKLIDALVAVGGQAGMELRTDSEVASITVTGGRATGVVLASGERIEARRAVDCRGHSEDPLRAAARRRGAAARRYGGRRAGTVTDRAR